MKVDDRNDRLAKWLSGIFHPFSMAILSLFLVIYLDAGSLAMALRWVATAVVVSLLPFAAFIRVMVRTKRYSDADVSIREQRHSLYVVGGLGLLAFLMALWFGDAPRITYACLYAALLGVGIGGIVNRFLEFKVSLHALVAAGSATTILYLSWPLGLVLVAATAAVGWARVYIEHHTWGQVATGWTIAVASVAVVFVLYL